MHSVSVSRGFSPELNSKATCGRVSGRVQFLLTGLSLLVSGRGWAQGSGRAGCRAGYRAGCRAGCCLLLDDFGTTFNLSGSAACPSREQYDLIMDDYEDPDVNDSKGTWGKLGTDKASSHTKATVLSAHTRGPEFAFSGGQNTAPGGAGWPALSFPHLGKESRLNTSPQRMPIS